MGQVELIPCARLEYIRLAGLQCAIAITGAVLAYFFVATPLAAKSVAYGSCIAIVSTVLLSRGLKQGERHENLSAGWYLRQAYQTAIKRYVAVIFLLALGFNLLEFAPLWMLAGFVGGQSAWLVAPVWTRLRTQNDKRSTDII